MANISAIRFWQYALFAFIFWGAQIAFAQVGGTRADYSRADDLEKTFDTHYFRNVIDPHWTADGNAFWYRSLGQDGVQRYYWVDAVKGTRTSAFNHSKLAISISKRTGRDENPDHLPIESIEMQNNEEVVMDVSGNQWAIRRSDGAIQLLPGAATRPTSTPALTEMPPARSLGSPTAITFVNRTSDSIQIYSVDMNGVARKNGEIPQDELLEIPTRAGSLWSVTNARGDKLGMFESGQDNRDAVIESSPPSTRENTSAASTTRSAAPNDAPESGTSPDGKWIAFMKDHNIYLHDVKRSKEYQLTLDGQNDDDYDPDLLWSPDSTKLVALKIKGGHPQMVNLIQFSPPNQIQPKIISILYYKPGDVLPTYKIHIFNINTRKDTLVNNNLFPNPLYIQMDNISWDSDSRRIQFGYAERGFQLKRLIDVDAESGEPTTTIEERSSTMIDGNKWFADYLDITKEIIWMSERTGWNHLYLYDEKTGGLKNPITKGAWVVRAWSSRLDLVDGDNRQIWFRASGLVPSENPYFVHYCRVDLDGTNFVDLTPSNGTHELNYSPDSRFYIDTYSRLDMAPVAELRRTSDGKLICILDHTELNDLQATGWQQPESFVAKGRDGKTDIYGVIYRPTNFSPSKKYPVIESIYASPEDSFVPVDFTVYKEEMSLAELGFIVVQIDGMGTNNRSKSFQDVAWRNLDDAGFPDRVLWIKAAAAKYPYIDLSRVGIYGYSEGGQNVVRALEAWSEFYKVGVSICGLHDDRLGDCFWTEQWMGWPIGPWYAEQSNVTNAAKMNGKLLLIGCEMDHAVDPASTMQMANALIKANKDFDLVVIPNAGHCEIGAYGWRRVEDYFVRNLLGVEPAL